MLLVHILLLLRVLFFSVSCSRAHSNQLIVCRLTGWLSCMGTLFHMILNYACELGRSKFPMPFASSCVADLLLAAISLPPQLVSAPTAAAATAIAWTVTAINTCVHQMRERYTMPRFLFLCVSREILEARIWFRYLFIWCSFDDVQKFILNSSSSSSFFFSLTLLDL